MFLLKLGFKLPNLVESFQSVLKIWTKHRLNFTNRNAHRVILLPNCFSLNNSETMKAVTLAFCSVRQHFIIDIRAKFAVPNLPQSPDIGQNVDGGISDFRISAQSFIKENCRTFRTGNDIDMKIEPVTKLEKKNMATSIKVNNDVISTNCVAIVVFRIYGQFRAILNPDSGRIDCETYIFSNSNLLSYKN